MPDIMKFIVNDKATLEDPDGNLLVLDEWSEAIAEKLAIEEGLKLTDDHWEVIRFLRDYYKNNGLADSARALLHVLEQRYQAQGGRKYLYQLFPKGPIRQSSRIAGLPVPSYSKDPSFGTSQ